MPQLNPNGASQARFSAAQQRGEALREHGGRNARGAVVGVEGKRRGAERRRQAGGGQPGLLRRGADGGRDGRRVAATRVEPLRRFQQQHGARTGRGRGREGGPQGGGALRRVARLPQQPGREQGGAVGEVLPPGAADPVLDVDVAHRSPPSSCVSKATRVMNSSGFRAASSGAASATASSSRSSQGPSALAKLPSTWPVTRSLWPGWPMPRRTRQYSGVPSARWMSRRPLCPAAPPPRFTRTRPGARSNSSWNTHTSSGGSLWKATAGCT